MKIELDIPDHDARGIMQSHEGRIATAVAANVLEMAYDSIEKHVKGGGSLDDWLAEARVKLAAMRRDMP